jgi:hypothetical protein
MTVTTHKTFCRFCHAYCATEVDVVDWLHSGISDPVLLEG